MGNFYTNLTLRGPDEAEIRRFLEGRSSYVSATMNACTVVLDEECDQQNPNAMTDLALTLSAQFKCPVFAVLIHDDDILAYFLCEDGAIVDQYNSTPQHFAETPSRDGQPFGGDAARLARAFAAADVPAIETILRKPHGAGYLFETERHKELALALGIPEFVVGVGFRYCAADDLPQGMRATYSPTFKMGR